jgi:hypothetical protein
MKLLLSLLVLAISGIVSPVVVAGQQGVDVGQKARPDPVVDMTLGDCEDVQTPDNPNGQMGGGLSPAAALQNYWYNKFKEVLPVKEAKVTVLEQPKHGTIEESNFISEFGPYLGYGPNKGYLGQDKITFLVEVGGKNVKVVTTLIVVDVAGLHGSPCFSGVKRISSTSTPELVTGLATWLSAKQ